MYWARTFFPGLVSCHRSVDPGPVAFAEPVRQPDPGLGPIVWSLNTFALKKLAILSQTTAIKAAKTGRNDGFQEKGKFVR
jgi:hypothetical protein